MHSEVKAELKKLNHKIDNWFDLISGYRTFCSQVHKGGYPYVRIQIPSRIQKLLHLKGGEIIEVKIKVLQYTP